MPFATKLKVAEGTDREWVLTDRLVYFGGYDNFIVNPGFVTDFASVPRILWAAFPPYGKYTKSAVIHDWLYVERPLVFQRVNQKQFKEPDLLLEWAPRIPITRKDADGIFYRIMKEEGTNLVKAWLMWKAVRLFGWIYWKKKTTTN